MYDELVNSLRICGKIRSADDYCVAFHDGCCEAEPVCMYELMMKAADAIEELQGKYFLMKKTAEWLAEKVPTWVPTITNRLPSAHELVLIYNPGYPMTTGFLYEDGRWRVRGVDYPDTPTHWMPLPEPPKEE